MNQLKKSEGQVNASAAELSPAALDKVSGGSPATDIINGAVAVIGTTANVILEGADARNNTFLPLPKLP